MKKVTLLSLACFVASMAFSQSSVVIYNGEDANLPWASLAGTVSNDVDNPLTTGVNTSAKCASIVRQYIDGGSDDGARQWSGAAYWVEDNKINLPANRYNRISVMFLKSTAGQVAIELQDGQNPNGFFSAQYTTPGEWQKIEFNINCHPHPVKAILLRPHDSDAAFTPSPQTMYWDNVVAYTEDLTAPVVGGATNEITLYDGDNINPFWQRLAATDDHIDRNAAGYNSAKGMYFKREASADADNAQDWSGALLGGCEKFHLNTDAYNRISVWVKKTKAGFVRLEVQKEGGENGYYSENYDTPNEWKKMIFNLGCYNNDVINNILFEAHFEYTTEQVEVWWDNLTAYYEAPAAPTLDANGKWIIYDGETVSPVWANWWSNNIQNNYTNPEQSGINTSQHCIAQERLGEDADPNGKPQSGGALWECDKVHIDPADYNRISIMVWKNVAGKVELELQSTGGTNLDVIQQEYTTVGQWQELVFDIPADRTATINNIILKPHFEEAGTFSTQTMYWDNLKVWLHDVGTGIAKNIPLGTIVKTEIYNLNGIQLKADNLQSLPQGVYILKQTDDKGNVSARKTINVK